MKINFKINIKKLVLFVFIVLISFAISFTYYFTQKNKEAVLDLNNRIDIFVSVLGNFGYGGMIHNFKNYVIRGDDYYYKNAERDYFRIKNAVERSKNLPLSKKELAAIDVIYKTASEYYENMQLLVGRENLTVKSRDKIVKVDDTNAIKAAERTIRNLERQERNLMTITNLIARYATIVIGVLVLMLAYMHYLDILKLDVYNRKLIKRNEELLQFSYRSSHDLRNPLTSMSLLCDSVLNNIDNGKIEDARLRVVKIKSGIKHLAEMVTHILDMARLDVTNKKQELLNFREMFDDIIGANESLLEKNEIEVDYSENLSRPHYGQRTRVFQILSNIMVNSFKYFDSSKEHHFVNVKFSDDDINLYLEIADNGVGISCENKDDVYEQFKRFHSDKLEGSGIGMHIVKKSIEHFNGKIDFETSSDGTVFYITIPTSAVAQEDLEIKKTA